MRLRFVLCLLPVLVFPSVLSADTSPSTGAVPSGKPLVSEVQVRDPESFFDEFFQDLPQELEIAGEEGKTGILVMYQMKDCPFCKRM